ncbi:unnamed protein product [Pleuronectes platessa]|uniref:Uncharacterized protein n=1 Tax=Pleuronectes platessa TaxID=8262 RepID=A0A9N7URP2_PLEPL|nr:unnamed protein product [Pleuronectes platessa]
MTIDSPLTRLRRRDKCLMFGTILLLGTLAVYFEMIGTQAWNHNSSLKAYSVSNIWRKSISDNLDQPNNLEDSAAWTTSDVPQPWKTKGFNRV